MDLLPSSQLIHYDPDKGLKKIAVAESAERLYRRAKDVTGLRRAIEVKLLAQGEYVCWRDSVVQHGGDHKSESRLHHSKLENCPRMIPVIWWRIVGARPYVARMPLEPSSTRRSAEAAELRLRGPTTGEQKLGEGLAELPLGAVSTKEKP